LTVVEGGLMKVSASWIARVLVPVLFCICLASGASAQRTMVIAVNGDWPPMKMKDSQGNLTGYEMDMIKAVGAEAGFQVTIMEVPWEHIFDDLNAGKFDAIMASVSITDQRKEKFDFSLPYFSAEQLLVVPKSLVLKSLEGKTIAAFESTTGAAALQKSELVAKKLYPAAETEGPFKDMAEGRIDGVICDTPVAINYAFLKEAYKGKFAIASEQSVLGRPSGKEEYGIVVKKGNTGVLDLLNSGIKAVKAKNIDTDIKTKWIKW
jgi:polar amino acid transport system substrate-binding protein